MELLHYWTKPSIYLAKQPNKKNEIPRFLSELVFFYRSNTMPLGFIKAITNIITTSKKRNDLFHNFEHLYPITER